MVGKRRKIRRKRWLNARVKAQYKAQRKARFIEGFRNHFVKKGILTELEIESGMNKVPATSGVAGSELEALTAKAREVGALTQVSATEASDALNYMAMAGRGNDN